MHNVCIAYKLIASEASEKNRFTHRIAGKNARCMDIFPQKSGTAQPSHFKKWDSLSRPA